MSPLRVVSDEEPGVAFDKNPLAMQSAKVEIQHEHSFQLGGSVCHIEHHHLVDPDAPEHVHPLNKATSYGRFALKALEGARKARRNDE